MNLTEFKSSPACRKPHLLLLGNPVAHSLSPFIHNLAASILGIDLHYLPIELQASELPVLTSVFTDNMFRGANITIPYKETLSGYMDLLDTNAKKIGAINTVVPSAHGLKGYNTDTYGFLYPLKSFKEELEGHKALVFGTGGATKAIIEALRQIGMQQIILVSRQPGRHADSFTAGDILVVSYEDWAGHAPEITLVVNATPLGMQPNIESSPVQDTEKEALSGKICYDIVYKPQLTRFLKQAQSVGARTIGGLDMLIAQGSKSFELWTGRPFPVQQITQKLYEHIQG